MMRPDVLAIAGAVVVTSLGVVLARRSARRRMTDPREPVDVRKIFERDVAPLGIHWSTYEGVLNAAAEAYELRGSPVDPRRPLRDLESLDSWDLGAGQERFERLLRERFGPFSLRAHPATLIDLMEALQQQDR